MSLVQYSLDFLSVVKEPVENEELVLVEDCSESYPELSGYHIAFNTNAKELLVKYQLERDMKDMDEDHFRAMLDTTTAGVVNIPVLRENTKFTKVLVEYSGGVDKFLMMFGLDPLGMEDEDDDLDLNFNEVAVTTPAEPDYVSEAVRHVSDTIAEDKAEQEFLEELGAAYEEEHTTSTQSVFAGLDEVVGEPDPVNWSEVESTEAATEEEVSPDTEESSEQLTGEGLDMLASMLGTVMPENTILSSELGVELEADISNEEEPSEEVTEPIVEEEFSKEEPTQECPEKEDHTVMQPKDVLTSEERESLLGKTFDWVTEDSYEDSQEDELVEEPISDAEEFLQDTVVSDEEHTELLEAVSHSQELMESSEVVKEDPAVEVVDNAANQTAEHLAIISKATEIIPQVQKSLEGLLSTVFGSRADHLLEKRTLTEEDLNNAIRILKGKGPWLVHKAFILSLYRLWKKGEIEAVYVVLTEMLDYFEEVDLDESI